MLAMFREKLTDEYSECERANIFLVILYIEIDINIPNKPNLLVARDDRHLRIQNEAGVGKFWKQIVHQMKSLEK